MLKHLSHIQRIMCDRFYCDFFFFNAISFRKNVSFVGLDSKFILFSSNGYFLLSFYTQKDIFFYFKRPSYIKTL